MAFQFKTFRGHKKLAKVFAFSQYLDVPKKRRLVNHGDSPGFLAMIGFTQNTERLHGMPTKQHLASLLTFLGWLSDPFKGQVTPSGRSKGSIESPGTLTAGMILPSFFFSVPT